MVSLIIGHKGSGKTKLLVDRVNAAVEKSNGNVICVEKETKLTYDVNYRARLVAADSFSVSGFDSLYGFLSGLCAGDHDITEWRVLKGTQFGWNRGTREIFRRFIPSSLLTLPLE